MKISMQKYALDQAATLLGRLAFQVNQVSKQPDPEPIHNMRISIRRFNECLRVWNQFLPGHSTKKIRRRMRNIMDLAAEVRNRDIALELLKQAGVASRSRLAVTLAQEREQAKKELQRVVRRWSKRNFSQKWRTKLNL